MAGTFNDNNQNKNVAAASGAATKAVNTVAKKLLAGVSLKNKIIIIACVFFLFLLGYFVTQLPAIIWSELTNSDDITKEITEETLINKEREILSSIYEALEGDYADVYAQINSTCSAYGADYQASLSQMVTPETVDVNTMFTGEDVSFSQDEWEAVVLFSAYSISMKQMLDPNETLDGKTAAEDIKEKIENYLSKEGNSYYNVTYDMDSAGKVKVYKNKVTSVDPETDEVIKTNIKYIVPIVTTVPLSTVAKDIFEIDEDEFKEFYGNDIRIEDYIHQMAANHMLLLHGQSTDGSIIDLNDKIDITGVYNKSKLKATLSIYIENLGRTSGTYNAVSNSIVVHDEINGKEISLSAVINFDSNKIAFKGKVDGTEAYAEGSISGGKNISAKGYVGDGATSSFIWPLEMKYHIITSKFGWRIHPILGTPQGHTGVDIGDGGINNSNVYASSEGTVTFAGPNGNYGNFVKIKHNNGTYTAYAHLSSITVKTGQNVKKKEVIGKVGNTGRSTGPHLHFEFINKYGEFKDPLTITTKPNNLVILE